MTNAGLMGETTMVEEDFFLEETAPGLEWGAVLAGAVIAAGVTFFLILVGAALGLSLAGTRNLTAGGAHSFLTIGAIYFLAAQAFGFALGGHIAGRLMAPALETEDEHFRADVHGLAVWSVAVVLGLGLVALMAAAGLGQAVKSPSQPMAYWSDKLLTGAPTADYAARNDQVSRLLSADALHPSDQVTDDRNQLIALVAAQNGLPPGIAAQRVRDVEDGIRADADAARHSALYIAMWSVFALLLGGFAAIVSTVLARFETRDDVRFWKRNEV
jgi:hypothetical protein